MFGYIRPVKGQLKVCEFDRFRACYCSMCHALGKGYGSIARNVLNYDFTFLSMLLWPEEKTPSYIEKRCFASPFRKKCTCTVTDTMLRCAGYSIILTWWKLKDSVADDSFFKALGSRIILLGLWHAYKKAAKNHPDFDFAVRSNLAELSQLEKTNEPSLDKAADKFALILSSASVEEKNFDKRRVLEQVLYHIGRWIYILDACDDLQSDLKKSSYNPLIQRFELTGGKMSPDDEKTVKATLESSRAIISSSYNLAPDNYWQPIIENIIYLGMPEIERQVINGTWKAPRRRAPK